MSSSAVRNSGDDADSRYDSAPTFTRIPGKLIQLKREINIANQLLLVYQNGPSGSTAGSLIIDPNGDFQKRS
jgi:hypothetical protein